MTQTLPSTLGALRRSAFGAEHRRGRSVKDELRANLLARLADGKPLFPGVIGYEDTVMPQVVNALLSRHHFILLGLRGQAKSRILRALTSLLDPLMPVIEGSEVNDDPFEPISKYGRDRLAAAADDMPIGWLTPDQRYVEKLATPDVTVADLIGDLDPIKAARGGHILADELSIHYGMLPRANRGIFALNELPDLAGKVQVGLFNVMQERDVQVKGYRVRLPLDVFVVASANPEDYTSRGRIITPLKDRYKAQIRTHYPRTRELELAIVRQEARLPAVEGITLVVPPFMEDIVGELTFQARSSADVNQASGVSVRMSIANYETLLANALRRALRSGESEAVPRISDLDALDASTSGKLELEYAGVERTESDVIRELVKRASKSVFDERVAFAALEPVLASFEQGWKIEVSAAMASREYLAGLDEIAGLRDAAARLAGGDSPARLASAIEFLLEGMHLSNKLNKQSRESGSLYGGA
jgi:magnesium chelatase subunit I